MADKTLVTGGAGFIGSCLVRRLLDRGHAVIVLDSMVRGSIDNLPTDGDVSVIKGDIRNAEDISKAMQHAPRYIAHLAANHYIPYCNENPEETVNVNVYGTQAVLSAARRSNSVEKVLFASTAAVYGPSKLPHKETEAPAPIDIYGVSKHCGELLVNFFHGETGIAALNARLFNVVGPRETNPHLLPDIFDQLPGPHIKLGNLLPKRDYIYVEDVADGFMALLDSDLESGSINVGTGHAYSAAEVVDAISGVLGRKLEIDSIPERQREGDRPFLVADNGALSRLGWSCRHDFASAIEQTLRYYKLM